MSTEPAGQGPAFSDQLGPLPARWYVIDRNGLATLCKDADDAQDVAAAAWVQWPKRGPYRVALLGDVAAEHKRLAKLGAVAAQVLRDMQAQDVLLEWQTLLDDALRA